MGNYQDLLVWQRAHALALLVYRSTHTFPHHERYGLTAQIRRAAISVVSNIAEGSGRFSDRDEIRFVRFAQGSLCEVQAELLLARDLTYLDAESWKSLDKECREIGRMLNGLIRSYLKPRNQKPGTANWRLATGD